MMTAKQQPPTRGDLVLMPSIAMIGIRPPAGKPPAAAFRGMVAAGTRFFAEQAAGMAQTVVRWRRMRQTTAELQALDDRTLRDIGLWRGEIPGVAAALAAGDDWAARR